MQAIEAQSSYPTYNILLLGETGVGKSTFINAFINYLAFDKLTDAENEELTYLISTKFTVTDDNYQPRTIQVGSSVNEVQDVGASATQNPKSYIFNIGNANIRLIDTPGVGDTRGADQDNINFDKLLRYIGELKELHAICILLKPNEARITVMFEYCIKQLLSRLEKSASDNIVFLFTNTRGTFYRPGETLTSLQKLFEETQRRPPFVKIPLSKTNVFCIDNESFRFLLILRDGIQFSEVERKNFIASWEQSSDECLRMVTYIASLKPHRVQDTISVNEARRLIVQLSQPLADIAEVIQKNITVLQRKKEELQLCTDDVEQLRKNLNIPVVNLKIDELTSPRTVCTSQKCCTLYEIDGKQTYHHEKSCCDPCYLKYIPTAIIGAPELIFCKAMLTNSDNIAEVIFGGLINGIKNLFLSYTNQTHQITCTVCGCSYTYHKHIYYQSQPYQDNIVNENVKSQIKTKENAKAAAEQTIREIEQRCTGYQNEQEIINKSIAKFAHFLQNNAITPYNDAYEHFLEYTIDREKSLGPYADKKRIQLFENMLRSYTKEKETLERALEQARQSDISASFITAAEVMTTVQTLYGLSYCGPTIKEMFVKQNMARRTENTKEREVQVETKKKGGIFKRLYNTFF